MNRKLQTCPHFNLHQQGIIKLLEHRTYNQMDMFSAETQAGCKKGYSTVVHMHTLGQVIEKANEYNLEIYLLFIGFRKAFDSTEHNSIWRL